ncbi:MAG: zf-HC2 domain-containing protein, partial [Oscillospiraceae bacterium]|nr:zf-HC2 domain-containing protein [Oscillospiraceae bacterium]
MKYCDEYAPALSAFVDGELTEQEKNEVLAHVETCEGCRTYLAELMTMRAAFGDLEEYDAPAGFAESVMARLHEEAAPKKRTQRKKWMGLAACAAVVLMAAVLFPHVTGSSGGADSVAAANDCEAALTESVQEPYEDEEFTDRYTSVQHTGLSLFNTAEDGNASEPASEPAAETMVTSQDSQEKTLTKN